MPIITKEIEKRFRSHLSQPDENGCINWLGGKNRKGGYGLFGFEGKTYSTHRIAWILKHGEIPEEKDVLHKCDNPACCNDEHFFLGTQLDNARDLIGKGRASIKLTVKDIITIRLLHSFGQNLRQIAECYKVSHVNIWKIIHRITWTDI